MVSKEMVSVVILSMESMASGSLYASPRGTEERKGLQIYMRGPGTARTAEEAITMIMNWKLARNRALGMGLPDVGDLEMRDGLVGIVKKLTCLIRK